MGELRKRKGCTVGEYRMHGGQNIGRLHSGQNIGCTVGRIQDALSAEYR
jgi:hypothetical protein